MQGEKEKEIEPKIVFLRVPLRFAFYVLFYSYLRAQVLHTLAVLLQMFYVLS